MELTHVTTGSLQENKIYERTFGNSVCDATITTGRSSLPLQQTVLKELERRKHQSSQRHQRFLKDFESAELRKQKNKNVKKTVPIQKPSKPQCCWRVQKRSSKICGVSKHTKAFCGAYNSRDYGSLILQPFSALLVTTIDSGNEGDGETVFIVKY